jgi:hypothetical protein
MDLKVLFHDPESLSDTELRRLREKIRIQRTMPWLSAFFGGFGLYFLDAAVLRRSACNKRIAAGAAVGYLLGAWGSYQVSTIDPERWAPEADIISAYDRRYMTTVLNATGFGSNYVSSRDFAETTTFKKPY